MLSITSESPLTCSHRGTPRTHESVEQTLLLLNSKLGRAGYMSLESQHRIRTTQILWLGGICASALFVATLYPSLDITLLAVGSVSTGWIGWLVFLRRSELEFQRNLIYSIPIALENLILLVEAGLGLIPAIGAMIENGTSLAVNHYFRSIFDACHSGIPVVDSFKSVAHASNSPALRAMCIHLELAATDGTELGPALRSLRAHFAREWKLSVEERIKRLENLVIFPVFLSVIGMMLLLAAVPLVPVFELRETLRQSAQGTVAHSLPRPNISTFSATPSSPTPNR